MKDKKKTKTIPRQVRWDKLDNTAHLFPSIAGGEYDKRVPDQCDLKKKRFRWNFCSRRWT